MSTKERKLAEWAEKKGIRFDLVRTQLLPGDVDAAAEQLVHAREKNAPEEVACVLFWMRLLEKRAAAMQVGTIQSEEL